MSLMVMLAKTQTATDTMGVKASPLAFRVATVFSWLSHFATFCSGNSKAQIDYILERRRYFFTASKQSGQA